MTGISESSYIIAGLGNPGPAYVGTRHNVGWMVVDALVAAHGLWPKTERAGEVAHMRFADRDTYILKPASYVNTSGKAIKTVAERVDAVPNHVIVVHDDLDLDFGVLRIKARGSSGGHRGIGSIIAALGSEDFPRVKIGIGRPPGRMEPADFVLKRFTRAEDPEIESAIAVAVTAAMGIIELGLEEAMNRFNQRQS